MFGGGVSADASLQILLLILTMSSSTPSTSKPADSSTKPNEQTKEDDAQPTLGVLEEDDEFEEFAVAG